MPPDTVKTVVPALFIGLGVCWRLICVVLLVRQGRKDRQSPQYWEAERQHWERETWIDQRVSELLAQEYEQSLSPEERQRREAQRQHLQQLRARAILEAEQHTQAHEEAP